MSNHPHHLPKNLKEYINDPSLNLVSLEDGSVISQRVRDLIETIEDRWPGVVFVNWIPPRALKKEDQQFCIVERLSDGREVPIFWVKDESEFTGEVLERLIRADNTQENIYDRMQAKNAALRSLQTKLAKDKMDEAHDIVKHVLKSPLNKYVVNKDITIRDWGNRTN